MTGFLYGMLGALVVDVVALVAVALAAPRLIRRAMQKKMGLALAGQYGAAFAKKPAGEA
jgi:hypothetical protein